MNWMTGSDTYLFRRMFLLLAIILSVSALVALSLSLFECTLVFHTMSSLVQW